MGSESDKITPIPSLSFYLITMDVRFNLCVLRLIPRGLGVTSRVNLSVPSGGFEPVTSEYPSQSFTSSEPHLGIPSFCFKG